MPDETMTMTETNLQNPGADRPPTPTPAGADTSPTPAGASTPPMPAPADTPPSPPPPKPPSIKASLDQALAKVAAGRDAEGLKAQLEPLLAKQAAALAKYTEPRRKQLVAQWWQSNKDLTGLWHDITCTFGDKWIEIVNESICPTLTLLTKQDEEVDRLTQRGEGLLEKAVNATKKTLDEKTAVLEAWLKTEETLTGQLKTINDNIVRIRTVLPDPAQRAISIYLFLWKAFPLHWGIRPPQDADGGPNAFTIARPAGLNCFPDLGRARPYLIEAADLAGTIDAAADEFLKADKAYNEALGKFKKTPDDAVSATKARDTTKTNLDATIETALKSNPQTDTRTA